MVAGGPVWGRAKLAVYSGSTLSLNHHHPMNDIVGRQHPRLRARGERRLPGRGRTRTSSPTCSPPGEEVVTYRDLAELRRQLDHYLAHPDEARDIGERARKRALAEHTLRHRIETMLAVLKG